MAMLSNALYNCLSVDLQDHLSGPESIKQFASQQLLKTVLKKFEDDVDVAATEKVAIDKFRAMNIRCAEWSLFGPKGINCMLDEYLVGAFEKRFHQMFYSGFGDNLEYYIERGRFGPGASVGASGTDFFTKIGSSALTATAYGIYRAYDNYISTIPFWRTAEIIRCASYGDVNIVEGSVLQCVPKNNTTARVICTEPALNMFAQLGVGNVIECLLKRNYGIDLSTQPEKNAELARLGSVYGSLFTIDLESASDTISLKMLERFMPETALGLLKALRSPRTRLPNGEVVELHMVSSMGNGFTFPLQTAIFCCALLASFDVHDDVNPSHTEKFINFGVFGDDIVGPTAIYGKVCRLLEILGFIVNKDKSFYCGPFRESCGADYYKGTNVRGVYIKSLATQASRYVAINRLNAWSAEHDIPLPETISCLAARVKFRPVPLHESDDSGIKLPLTVIGHRITRLQKPGQTCIHQYVKLVNVPRTMSITHDGHVVLPKHAKHRIYNPAALITAFLGGYVTNGVITLRQSDGAIPGTRRCVTPHWDYIPWRNAPYTEPVSQQVLYRRLVNVSVVNFFDYLRS